MSKLLHFLSIFFLTTVLLSQPDGWSATPNPSSGVFIGQATINGTPAGEGDWSAAFDEDGNCAGAVVLIINAGTAYINMPIYGDDSTTPDVDEGMNAGESFILKIWDSSTGDILDYPESFDCWYNNNGAPMGGCGGYTEVYDFPGGVLPDNPFEGLTTPNPSSGVFLGQATIDGTPAGVGDWSAAFDEDGNCAGAAEIILNGGVAYVNMPIYGDDNTTPDVDEGINAGENFVLKLWDSSEDAIMIYSTEFDCWYNNNGAPMDGCGGVTEVYDFQTTIENLPPVAEAGYDQTIEVPYPYAPAEVTLDGSGSSDEDGMIVSWEWTWTGGAVSGETVSASFAVGVHAVTLTVTDDDGATDTDEVTITVNEAPNEAPVADDNSVTTVEDTPIDITLTGSDPEGDDLTYEVTSAPDHGSLSGSAPNLTYSPNADYNGSDSFIFSVSDGEFSDEGTVSITIDAVNDPPVVTVLGGPFETPEETALAIDIEVSDIEGDLADLLVVGDPLHGTGTMVDNGGGSFTYTYIPSDGYVGSDAVIIQAQETETEEQLFSEQVNIQITVIAVNDPPVAEDISVELSEDGSVDITLVGSDEDTPDDLLSIEIVDSPLHGTLNAAGRVLDTYTYTPDLDYNGDDSFTYHVFDGELYSEIATVTITITPVNDAPVVTVLGGPFETPEETALAIDIEVSDIEGDLADLLVVGDPLHGTGTMVDNGDGSFTYTYTPSDGYVGSDAVIIQAQETETEEHLFSEQVNIQITVIAVNDPPVAEDISVELSEDGSVDITLVGSDEDTDDNLLSIEIVDSPSHGTLTAAGRVLDTYTYTPDPDYYGDDSFTYHV
ncbi:MAG TPA: Ig-like domain-containing protein, partial [Candidatus Marinimicrobia bacterium]|nr:Ig-like domain-containing protein [Candidatus Neomarinimicrobiota bacterium]